MSNAVLPFAAPPWLTPRRIAIAAVALGGAAAGVPATVFALGVIGIALIGNVPLGLGTLDEALVCTVIVMTALLSAFHGRCVVQKSECVFRSRSLLWRALDGPLAPFLLALLLMSLVVLLVPWLGDLACFAGLLSAPLGAGVGVGFVSASRFPVRVAVRALSWPAHDDAERALSSCGNWLAGMSVLGVALPISVASRSTATLTLVVGLGSAALGALQRRRRRRWLAAVVAGKVRNFRIAPEFVHSQANQLIPFYRKNGAYRELLLEAIEPSHAAPYRGSSEARAVALVPADLH